MQEPRTRHEYIRPAGVGKYFGNGGLIYESESLRRWITKLFASFSGTSSAATRNALTLYCYIKKNKTQLLVILSLISTIALEISLLAFPSRPCVDLLVYAAMFS